MTRVLFIVRRLEGHGAERQLVALARGMDRSKFQIAVMCFYPGGALEPELAATPGVTLVRLEKTGRWDIAGFFVRALRAARAFRPDVIHGYLTMPNLIALALGRLTGARVVWGIRNTYASTEMYGWLGRLELWSSKHLARFADLIIFNAHAAAERHAAIGFRPRATAVVSNGIDTSRFYPDREAGRALRREWHADDSICLVGIVGRVNPQKDHATFLDAAARCTEPGLRFVSIGDAGGEYADRMRARAASLGITDRMVWAGAMTDMTAALNALDIVVSCSIDEGLSNAIAEAMAGGLPCVVTDVGDSRFLVGDAGIVVAPGDADAIAREIDALRRDRARRGALGAAARRRVERDFSLDEMVSNTESLLTRGAGHP